MHSAGCLHVHSIRQGERLTMADESLIFDLMDSYNLPLKNRVSEEGYYSPGSGKRAVQVVGVADPEVSLIPSEPLRDGEQYRFHFDMSICVGCQCCVVACNEQNNNPAPVNWRRVGEIEGGVYPNAKRFHMSMACNHCLDPACLTGCPTDAYVKDTKTGVVQQKAEECIGCRYCTWNCPYGVPQFNEERGIVTKCDMCHSRLADGMAPACVSACPEKAIRIEKVNVAEWRENHSEADAPHMPDSGITISTTRLTLPEAMPEEMLRLNRHRVEPEEAHKSLIVMTVLTQLAAGGFMTLWLGSLLAHAVGFLKPLEEFLVFGASGILAVTGLALSASVFHLGRPLYAYKALRMWKRSWLSREILFFALFSFSGASYAAILLAGYFLHWEAPGVIHAAIGGIAAFSGMAGIFASAKIYLVPARPSWNTIRTPLRFFLTGFILGPLFSLVLYGAHLVFFERDLTRGGLGPVLGWLAVSSCAGFAQLLVLFARLFQVNEGKNPELYDSALLLTRRFRVHFLLRVGLLALNSFILPFFYLSSFLDRDAVSGMGTVVFSGISFLIALFSEFLGRYLFFVTVVPKNMPGSFFTERGGKY